MYFSIITLDMIPFVKIAIVLGTRPEIIKMAPIKECIRLASDYIIIRTGQPYSFEMDRFFLINYVYPSQIISSM